MGFLIKNFLKRPNIKKAFKEVKETKKEVAKKVVETKKDTYSAAKRKGKRSTIKTSSSGLNDGEIKKKTLLG